MFKLTWLFLISVLLIACEAPVEQPILEGEDADSLAGIDSDNDGPLDEENYHYLKISINDEPQELLNSDTFVGCKRTYGSHVLDINISGDSGTFLGKNGRFEITFPLVTNLGDNAAVLYSDSYNPIGMPIVDFIADDAPSEFIELPIGIIEVPQVTHSLVSVYNDPEIKPACSIKVSQRGSVKKDFGSNGSYGVKRQYREFEIDCHHYVAKDQLANEFLSLEVEQLKIQFNCEEVVYY